jgi:hypothetical protein
MVGAMSLAGTAIKTGLSAYQYFKGNKEDKVRDSVGVSQGATDKLNLLKNLSQRTKMPGQDLRESGIENSSATTAQQIMESGGNAGSLASLRAGTEQNKNNLSIEAAQQKVANEYQLASGLGEYGQLENAAAQRKLDEENAYTDRGNQRFNALTGNLSGAVGAGAQGFVDTKETVG